MAALIVSRVTLVTINSCETRATTVTARNRHEESRGEHFYREVCGKYQRYAASNRRYDQHQRHDEVDAQCAERIKGGQQHQ